MNNVITAVDKDNPLYMGHKEALELLLKIKEGKMSKEEIDFLEGGEINKLFFHIQKCMACKEKAKSLGLLAKPKPKL